MVGKGKLAGVWALMGMENADAKRRRSLLIHLSLFRMESGGSPPVCWMSPPRRMGV